MLQTVLLLQAIPSCNSRRDYKPPVIFHTLKEQDSIALEKLRNKKGVASEILIIGKDTFMVVQPTYK